MKSKVHIHAFLFNAVGGSILAFGLYNVHAFSGVTEGGVLGMTLLLRHFFAVSPSVSSLVLDGLCYLFGVYTLGPLFILHSAISSAAFSATFAVCERFPPLWPQLAAHPLFSAIVGAIFVGVGVGISVRAGGATGGDDALAMGLSKLTGQPIERLYLISDLSVLALSATYIPIGRLACSLLTVVLSGQIIGLIQRIPTKRTDSPL